MRTLFCPRVRKADSEVRCKSTSKKGQLKKSVSTCGYTDETRKYGKEENSDAWVYPKRCSLNAEVSSEVE